jgi:hypothetical protein
MYESTNLKFPKVSKKSNLALGIAILISKQVE